MTNEDYYSVFDQMIEELQTEKIEGLSKVISSNSNYGLIVDIYRIYSNPKLKPINIYLSINSF